MSPGANIPGPELDSLSDGSDAADIARLDVFKTGYTALIERFTALTQTTQQLLSSSVIGNDERQRLADQRQEIDRQLNEIQKLGRELTTDINPGTLEKTATREYHTHFAGDISEHRLHFVQFRKTHELLEAYYRRVVNNWNGIAEAFDRARINENSEIRRQITSTALKPATATGESLRVFVERMGRLLRLDAGPAVYSPEIAYQLSTVFTANLKSYVQQIFGGLSGSDRLDPAQLSHQELLGPGTRGAQAGAAESPAKPAPIDDWRLDASGNTPWNQSPHYYFQYDPRVLDQERLKFADVIYADTHMGAEQEFIKSDFILNVSRKARLSEKTDIEAEYVNFLHSFFNLVIDISMLNVDIPPKDRNIFVYHMGPQSFYNLTIKFLQEVNTGALHRRAQGKRVITKFLPGELIKKTIIGWWRTEVLESVPDEERDDPAYLKRITNAVRKMHGTLSEKAIEEHAKLPDSAKAGKSRQEVFRENMSNWMGATNIIIFRRFLKPKK